MLILNAQRSTSTERNLTLVHEIRTVVLVGTDHKFQVPSNELGVEEFRRAMRALCKQHKVLAIAEEMSLHALKEKGATESVALQLCADLDDLRHQFSDPSHQERWKLGIRQDNDIRVEHLSDDWTLEQIEADVAARGRAASDPIRERFWWSRIQQLNTWPLLFICGANHFVSFAALLRGAGVEVIEEYRDWEPK